MKKYTHRMKDRRRNRLYLIYTPGRPRYERSKKTLTPQVRHP